MNETFLPRDWTCLPLGAEHWALSTGWGALGTSPYWDVVMVALVLGRIGFWVIYSFFSAWMGLASAALKVCNPTGIIAINRMNPTGIPKQTQGGNNQGNDGK
ncbi:hypothetical protein [Litoribacter populi]|uniref:hypothetical protein n=1 Tax=Litoribacter populi TaxID=2598460 RepID=UPI001181429D|nr:hypothetical protein [Litoribacter populi]